MRAKRQTDAEKVRAYRLRQRSKGLKPAQLWVYDTSSPAFIAEVARECAILRNDPGEDEIMDWIDAATADLFDEEE